LDEFRISVEHRENATLQRSVMSIENGIHTFSHSSGVLCVEITDRSAGADMSVHNGL